MNKTSTQVEKRQRVTLDAIAEDLNDGDWEALYYATEDQILSLINANRISEDFLARHQDYQEEMRVLIRNL
jgi:hypothetical protein|tara:strand:- start:45 stop:257 length:213 start_codon:yes stop_codon:yes gene_type:complete